MICGDSSFLDGMSYIHSNKKIDIVCHRDTCISSVETNMILSYTNYCLLCGRECDKDTKDLLMRRIVARIPNVILVCKGKCRE